MPLEATLTERRQLGKQRAFLSHFEASGNVLASAKLAGVSRQLVYYWRGSSPSFAKKLSAAADVAFKGSLRIPPGEVSEPRGGAKIRKPKGRTV